LPSKLVIVVAMGVDRQWSRNATAAAAIVRGTTMLFVEDE
jgi:hypothetical protein